MYIWQSITQTLNPLQTAIIRIKNKNCFRQREFALLGMNLCKFCSEGTGKKARLIKYLIKGLHGVQLLES